MKLQRISFPFQIRSFKAHQNDDDGGGRGDCDDNGVRDGDDDYDDDSCFVGG